MSEPIPSPAIGAADNQVITATPGAPVSDAGRSSVAVAYEHSQALTALPNFAF
jgi:hypothetical protein